MTTVEELIEGIGPLRRADLEIWIEEALIVPESEGGTLSFSDAECARVRLICTLRYELEIDEETLPLVLSLVDQLYETRGRLHALGRAVSAQDAEVQEAILAALAGTESAGR